MNSPCSPDANEQLLWLLALRQALARLPVA